MFINGFHANLRSALCNNKRRTTLAMERSITKIGRYVAPGGGGEQIVDKGNIAEAVAYTLNTIHAALDKAERDAGPHPWRLRESPEEVSHVTNSRDMLPANVDGLVSRRDATETWYLFSVPGRSEAMAEVLDSVRRRNVGATGEYYCTRKLFEYFLRNINPMAYYRLRKNRVVSGVDVLEALPQPTERGVLRFFRTEAAHMLRLPVRQMVENGLGTNRVVGLERRVIRLLHFVEYQEILLSDEEASRLSGSCPRPNTLLDVMLENMSLIEEGLDHFPSALQPGGSET